MKNPDKNLNHLYIKNYLPHNFLAEKIVLSSLLINNEIIENALNNLTTQTFYFTNHQKIYEAIISLYLKNNTIDVLTLTTYLQDQGLLHEIGGISVLIELAQQIPNLAFLDDYMRILQDKFLRRTLIKLGYSTINSSYITNIPLENILNDLELELFNLKDKTGDQLELPNNNSELFLKVFLELKSKSLKSTLNVLNSGFCDLDSIIQGFQKSDLIIIAGRPSLGKTALSLNIAINIIKRYKTPVLFFSLEMSKEQLLYRVLANEAEVSTIRLRSGHIYKNDWLNLNNIFKTLACLPFFIDDRPTVSIQEIRLKIKKLIFNEASIGLIIIDYLQLMQNFKSPIDNRVQELSQITRSLKIIAREFNVPIIALSQLSRNVENRLNKKPILSDLRESGSIEQDADLVLMLYENNLENLNKKEIKELLIAKNRNGPVGSVKLRFDPIYTKFYDYN
jgi:replicative DNA helicase